MKYVVATLKKIWGNIFYTLNRNLLLNFKTILLFIDILQQTEEQEKMA